MPPVFLNLVEVNFKVDQLTEDLRDQGQVNFKLDFLVIENEKNFPNLLKIFVMEW